MASQESISYTFNNSDIDYKIIAVSYECISVLHCLIIFWSQNIDYIIIADW